MKDLVEYGESMRGLRRKNLSKKAERKLLIAKREDSKECICHMEFENHEEFTYDPELPVIRIDNGVEILRCAICGKEYPNLPAMAGI